MQESYKACLCRSFAADLAETCGTSAKKVVSNNMNLASIHVVGDQFREGA